MADEAKKLVPCDNPSCGERRRHWCDPDTPRGTQTIEVPADHVGKAYCSIECWCRGENKSVRTIE